MDLPVIETPIAPRWVWMEEVTYSHIPIATLITAFLALDDVSRISVWQIGALCFASILWLCLFYFFSCSNAWEGDER
jgi:hypothetical protein